MTMKNRMQAKAEQRRLEMVGEQADEIVKNLGLSAPIDPFVVIRSEKPLIKAGGRDLGSRYDGKLEYHRGKNRFLLFFNTKYDEGLPPGSYHPRTRFSICHELGHYFLERHRAYLMRPDAKSHASQSEFFDGQSIEREADAFASSLLLPTHLARAIINQAELSLDRLRTIADHFNTSLISTTFRSVRLSDFPCAVAGIREGVVAWIFPSRSLIETGLYPRRGHLPLNAGPRWAEFQVGAADSTTSECLANDWFSIYNEQMESAYVTERFIPVPAMRTLLVLLTLDEDGLFSEEEDEW